MSGAIPHAAPASNAESEAFPRATSDGYTTPGLTKREYFAGLAMQGLIGVQLVAANQELRAELAVQYADTLLAELAK